MELKMNYTIKEFWKPRFESAVRPNFTLGLVGWSVESERNSLFVEADLRLRSEFADLTAPIWFVAAPGAVGKSTLAKEISALTGATYLDLAKADTVAGNYLTGGLVRNNLFAEWKENQTIVLIDALDEARLRVTRNSFEDFLADVRMLTHGRKLPTVFFGRTGLVEEAWLILSDGGLTCPIFDIDFFDPPRAQCFIIAALNRLAAKVGNEKFANSLNAHRSVHEDAAAKFVHGLEQIASSDGARFAGYAPVLEAVATVLSGVTDPAHLNDTIRVLLENQG